MQQNENHSNENEEEKVQAVRADDLVSAEDRSAFVRTFLTQAIVIGIAVFIGSLIAKWIIKNFLY